ncbi:hypothetical protein Ae201684P_003446 [Aphanomyces euteiches]|nr:hypothetical protein Ae201684P_003446 [Aphanomyces euteiches]
MFPSLFRVPDLAQVLQLCLASLVYHRQFVVNLLPQRHPLLSTAIFRDNDMFSNLFALVRTDSQVVHATGIPPHVELHVSIMKNYEALTQMPLLLGERIEEILEKHGVAAGHITQDILRTTIENALRSFGRFAPSMEATPAQQQCRGSLHAWGGRLRKLPHDFCLPSVNVLQAWQLWWIGNAALGTPPFKFLVLISRMLNNVVSSLSGNLP